MTVYADSYIYMYAVDNTYKLTTTIAVISARITIRQSIKA